jgi:hypothetical protein
VDGIARVDLQHLEDPAGRGPSVAARVTLSPTEMFVFFMVLVYPFEVELCTAGQMIGSTPAISG